MEGGEDFDWYGTLAICWLRMDVDRNSKFLSDLWFMKSSILESIRLATSPFPKKPWNNKNLRRIDDVIHIHD